MLPIPLETFTNRRVPSPVASGAGSAWDIGAVVARRERAEDRLHEVGITVNRNAVPDDPRPPMVTSGLRIGTSALATRGFQPEDFREVADVIAEALKPAFDKNTTAALKARVAALATRHPLYSEL